MTDDSSQDPFEGLQVRSFDPISAFRETVFAIAKVIEVFENPASGMTPVQFLEATRAAGEQLNAIILMTMHGLLRPVENSIDPNVLNEFRQRIETEHQEETPEAAEKRAMAMMRRLSANYQGPVQE